MFNGFILQNNKINFEPSFVQLCTDRLFNFRDFGKPKHLRSSYTVSLVFKGLVQQVGCTLYTVYYTGWVILYQKLEIEKNTVISPKKIFKHF